MAIMAPMAHAASSFTVDFDNGKFFVTRSNTTGSETVLYRTVSFSALAGVHFAPVSGSLTFNDGDETLEVPVTEYSSVPAIYRYQDGNSRSYMLEVLDINGYYLAKKVRYIGYGSASNVTKAKFNEVKSYTISSSEFTVTDKGYKQRYHAIPVTNFFTSNVPYEYLAATRCKLEMLVEFDACEVDDGYQYIQILINNETTCDEGAQNGDPGGTDYSIYKAGFTHEGGKKNTTYAHYAFPSVQDYNYYNDDDDNAGRPNYAWRDDYGNTVGRLIKQFFKARGTNDYYYYRNNDGWLELPLSDSDDSNYTLNTVVVRFDASGDRDDDWMVKNLVAKVKVDDNAGRSVFLLASEGLVVSPGPYKKGNTFYISIPADRIIVHNDDYPKLTTSWGTALYESGSGSNVMTFKGTITANAGTVLSISSYSGTIKSLSGQHIAEGIAGTTFNNCVVSEDYTLDDNTEIIPLFDQPVTDVGLNKPRPFTVKWRGKTLVEGTDFTLSYANNDGPQSGTKEATVVVTGMGHYSGTVTGTFTIRAVELSDFNEIETGVYEIANRDDLMHLSGFVNGGRNNCEGLTFRQTHDIPDVGDFFPIGAHGHFNGHYDGQGFIIGGVNILVEESLYYYGLFGYADDGAVLEGIKLVNSTIYAGPTAGAIVGYARFARVLNCFVGADVSLHTKQGLTGKQHGGIVGDNTSSRIEGCVSAAAMDAQQTVGGIAGHGYSGRLRNNLYTGTSVISGQNVGAIWGQVYTPYPNYFFNNYYLDSNQPGAVAGADINGARFGHTITLGDNITIDDEVVEYNVSGLTAFGESALMYDGVIYSGTGQTITLGYDSDTSGEGYEITYYVNGTAIEGNTFEMPNGDVTVTATVIRHRYSFNSETGELRLIWGDFDQNFRFGSDVTKSNNVLSITATDEVAFTGACNGFFSNFSNCVSMDLSLVNTDNATGLGYMFSNCVNLTTLDLSGWNTSSVTQMTSMFESCYSLTTIYVGDNWNTDNVTLSNNMFRDCDQLKGGRGTVYDPQHLDKEYARIDMGASAPGYLSATPTLASLEEVLDSEDGGYIISTPVAIATRNDDYVIVTDGDNWLKLTGAIDDLAEDDVIANINGILTTDQAGNPSFDVKACEPSEEYVDYTIEDIALATCTQEQLLSLTSCQLVSFEGYYKASEGTLRGYSVTPQGMSISLDFGHSEPLANGAHVKVTGVLSFKQAWDAEASGAPRRVPRTGNDAFQNLSLDVTSVELPIITSITDVLAAGREIKGIYNLQGVKLQQPTRGNIYIVKYADGTAEKVRF